MNLQALKNTFPCEVCYKPLVKKSEESNGVVCANCLHMNWLNTNSESGKKGAQLPSFYLSVLQIGSVLILNDTTYTVCGWIQLKFTHHKLQIWNLRDDKNKMRWLTETPGFFKLYSPLQQICDGKTQTLKNAREGKTIPLISPPLEGDYYIHSYQAIKGIDFGGEIYIPEIFNINLTLMDARNEKGEYLLSWHNAATEPVAICGKLQTLDYLSIQNPNLILAE